MIDHYQNTDEIKNIVAYIGYHIENEIIFLIFKFWKMFWNNWCTNLNITRNSLILVIWTASLLFTVIMTITFSIIAYSGCQDVKSCVYSLGTIPDPDCLMFYYEWVINNRTGCKMWCDNPHNWATCPQDGSICIITRFVRDYCQYYGFADLFNCGDNAYRTISLMFGLLTLVLTISGLSLLCTL